MYIQYTVSAGHKNTDHNCSTDKRHKDGQQRAVQYVRNYSEAFLRQHKNNNWLKLKKTS